MKSQGCLKHDLHQSASDPSIFMFYEHWLSEQAHEKHILRPEVITWREKLPTYLAKPYQAYEWKKIL